MGAVRVAIIGVGNCASALVQGVQYYRNAPDDKFIPGLMHPRLGGYHVGDIEFSAAFDIDERKVGRDLSEAIFQQPNNTVKFSDFTGGVPLATLDPTALNAIGWNLTAPSDGGVTAPCVANFTVSDVSFVTAN